MSAVLIARGVSYEFTNGRELFNDLNVSLEAQRAALVGPNGVGKSTLARILAGELQPTAGSVRRHSPVKLIPQREEPPPVTVTELLGGEYEWSSLGARLLEQIQLGTLCSSLSGGQWMRVRLARVLRDRFLILDEPTNDLDPEGREVLFQFLREHAAGVLLISHDRECLQLCSEIFELSNRGLMKYGGDWSAYAEAKEQERERLATALELAKRDRDSALVDRAEQRARQERRNQHGTKAAARGGMPKLLRGARKRRAEASTGKLQVATLARTEKRIRETYEALSELKIDPVMYAELLGREVPTQKLVAEACGFNIRFQDWIYPEDLHFAWRGNIRIALQGANGSGKSTLLQALLGGVFETRGRLRRGDLATLYLDQRCALLDDNRSVLENVRALSRLSETEVRNDLAKFLFAGETVFQPAADLSGGERLRAALACGLMSTRKPELMILDEPTNNLDYANVQFLEGIVSRFRGALVIVSHDEVFLENCRVERELKLGPVPAWAI